MSRSGSTSDVSSLDFSAGIDPATLTNPWKDNLTKDLGKEWKKKYPGAKRAKIKGQPHQSHKAPEQGVVLSIQLLADTGKKIINTIHMFADGAWQSGKDYYKKKK